VTGPAQWLRELRHSWPLLRGRRQSEITTAPLPLGQPSAPVRVGVDGTGARHLLVPVGDEDVRVDAVEGALRVELRTYTFARVPLRYVDISCVRPDLFDLFDEVLVDVLAAVESTPDAAARTALEVVGRWRALLGTHRARLLTLVGQMSLFAELTVLDLVTRSRTLDISWWRGPRREPHDIVLPGCALEVKAIGAATSSVEIHGVHQLELPGKPLTLVLATLAEEDTGTGLPDLVERVLGRVDDRGKAVRLLAAAGYAPADAERYRERFAVTELAHVEITETVPRIVPQSFGTAGVPTGVDGITYRIELDALDGFATRGETALLDWVGAAG
jgi:hypothetical protein